MSVEQMGNQKRSEREEEEENNLSRDGRILHSELILLDNCSEEEEQTDWRIFDHNQTSQELLALGLILFSFPFFCNIFSHLLSFRVKKWISYSVLQTWTCYTIEWLKLLLAFIGKVGIFSHQSDTKGFEIVAFVPQRVIARSTSKILLFKHIFKQNSITEVEVDYHRTPF